LRRLLNGSKADSVLLVISSFHAAILLSPGGTVANNEAIAIDMHKTPQLALALLFPTWNVGNSRTGTDTKQFGMTRNSPI
jgi:hypothetical protein